MWMLGYNGGTGYLGMNMYSWYSLGSCLKRQSVSVALKKALGHLRELKEPRNERFHYSDFTLYWIEPIAGKSEINSIDEAIDLFRSEIQLRKKERKK